MNFKGLLMLHPAVLRPLTYTCVTCGVTVTAGHVGQMQMSQQTGAVGLQTDGSRERDDLQPKSRDVDETDALRCERRGKYGM